MISLIWMWTLLKTMWKLYQMFRWVLSGLLRLYHDISNVRTWCEMLICQLELEWGSFERGQINPWIDSAGFGFSKRKKIHGSLGFLPYFTHLKCDRQLLSDVEVRYCPFLGIHFPMASHSVKSSQVILYCHLYCHVVIQTGEWDCASTEPQWNIRQ